MNVYKRKSFQFSNEQCSRLHRKAEVLKTRESSRFKHLSINRDLTEEMDSIKSADIKKEDNPRSLLLLKWKQEKQLRKEQEINSKRKPFYVGGCSQPASRYTPNKNLQSMKSSFMDHTTSRIFNASKIVKSRLVDSKSSTLSSKIPSVSKQGGSKSASQLSKIPSFPRQASVTNATGNKNNRKPVVKNDFTEKNVTKTNGSSLKARNQASSVYGSVDKNDNPMVKNTFNGKNSIKPIGSSLKTVNQGYSVPKLTISKPVQKIPAPSTKQKHFIPPKPQKMIPTTRQEHVVPPKPQKVPSAKPVHSEPPQKEISNNRKDSTRKGYCFKKFITDARKQQTECKSALKENKSNEVKTESKVQILSEQSQLNMPEKSLNWDISIIKPKSSFAPDDFKFKPPALLDFVFDDEDPDEVLEQIKVKYMSRTSTPSKETESSGSNHTLESPCKESANKNSSQDDFSVVDVKHSSEIVSTALDVKHSSEIVIPTLDSKQSSQADPPTFDVKHSAEATTPISDVKHSSKVVTPISDVKHSSKVASPVADVKNPSQAISPVSDVKNSFSTVTPILNVKDLSQNETHIIMDSPKTSFNKSKENYENLEIDKCESKPVNALDELSACSDSPFNILDLSEIGDDFGEEKDFLLFQNEEINTYPKESECARRKVELSYKRVSMLKNIPTLNAIAEADDCTNQSLAEPSKENQNTRRRSKRLSATCRQNADIMKEVIPEETTLQALPSTPRRSVRLQKKKEQTTPVLSPFQQPKSLLRRSMRLIDLNTPESDLNQPRSKSNLTADFGRLRLDDSENLDPSSFLTALEMSPTTSGLKSRKVSLLYSPEKNKAARKSVRGDLMAFSPI